MEKSKIRKTKEEILKALESEGERKMLCPFCSHDVFIRSSVEEGCRVHIFDDGDSVRDEDIDMNVTEYTYKCEGCKKDVTEEELKKE